MGEAGSAGAGHVVGDAGLKDAVAIGDTAEFFIVEWAIQRMSHRADQQAGSVAGELGVGIERDDVLDAGELFDLCRRRKCPFGRREGR